MKEADRKIAALQAKIDALMLEYCPEEMTPEQIAEWSRHQKPVEPPPFKPPPTRTVSEDFPLGCFQWVRSKARWFYPDTYS